VILKNEKIPARIVSPQQNTHPRKKEKKERKESRIKSKSVETSYANTRAWQSPWKKERMINSGQLGETSLKESENGDNIIVQNPICGLIQTNISFSFALSSNPWFFLLTPKH
jgi:hypothetical protein